MAAKRKSSQSKSAPKTVECLRCHCRFVGGPKLDAKTCPCPDCGHYAAEQFAAERARRHFKIFVASFSLILPPTLIGFGLITIAEGCTLSGLIGILAVVGHLVVATRNTNLDIGANLKRANALIDAHQLNRISAGDPTAETIVEPTRPMRRQFATVLVMSLCVVGIVSAEVLRRANGWVRNDSIFPEVVGPGDSFTVDFSDINGGSYEERNTDLEGLRSLGGIWEGTASIRTKVDAGYANIGIQASTRTDGEKLEGRRISSKKERPFTPWMKGRVSNLANLAWRQCDLEVSLGIKYPVRSSNQGKDASEVNYQFGTAQRSKDMSLVLSSPHAGKFYLGTALIGGLGGSVLLVICSYAMTRSSSPQTA